MNEPMEITDFLLTKLCSQVVVETGGTVMPARKEFYFHKESPTFYKKETEPTIYSYYDVQRELGNQPFFPQADLRSANFLLKKMKEKGYAIQIDIHTKIVIRVFYTGASGTDHLPETMLCAPVFDYKKGLAYALTYAFAYALGWVEPEKEE